LKIKGQQKIVLVAELSDPTAELPLVAELLPRTILSTVSDSRYPTAMMARIEMRSWRLLHFEGSALRQPDRFNAVPQLGKDGSRLPATLRAIATRRKTDESIEDSAAHEAAVYSRVSNRLAELNGDVREVRAERDELTHRITLTAKTRDGTTHPAAALSDGTLRFLALTILQLDPRATGLFCIEEPENGIHPRRIASLLRLLQDIATDTSMAVDEDNPLRQVIINTHSPTVVLQVPGRCVAHGRMGGRRSGPPNLRA
jgi:predicted ATPase